MCLGAIYWARLRKVYFASSRADAALVGFDDESFYREMAKPIEERSLPMEQALREEALSVFSEWEEKSDKTRY
jgi:tRNA(Arg) A34 adenosine deaminase TadA